jgi:hypothetical protein
MTVEEARFSLVREISDEHSNNHSPYDCKYSKWKIIDYIWACHAEKVIKGEIMDTLLNLYREAGMTDEEMKAFISKTELILDAINRNPYTK